MPSERFRKIFPYVSIGVGILVYVLYYNSTQNWKQMQSEYEQQQVQERQKKKRAKKEYMSKVKPWISIDGKEIYEIVKREEQDGLIWIQLTERKENITYNLRYSKSGSGEKYTSKVGNLFWMKGDEAIFENKEGKKSNLKSAKIYKGLYSYMADANTFKICGSDQMIPITMLGDNIEIERAYSKIGRSGEDVYLEVEGAIIKEKSMEGDEMIDAVYPFKLIGMEDRKECE